MSDSAKLMGCLLLLALIPASLLIRAWALVTLWAWFVVPTFDTATLTYVNALGLSSLVMLMTFSPTQAKDERDGSEKAIAAVMHGVGLPVLAVLFGWFYLLFA